VASLLGAQKEATPTFPRYSVALIQGGAAIVDNQSNQLYVYGGSKEPGTNVLEWVIDLKNTGNARMVGKKIEPEDKNK
jgi:hypothetical protein